MAQAYVAPVRITAAVATSVEVAAVAGDFFVEQMQNPGADLINWEGRGSSRPNDWVGGEPRSEIHVDLLVDAASQADAIAITHAILQPALRDGPESAKLATGSFLVDYDWREAIDSNETLKPFAVDIPVDYDIAEDDVPVCPNYLRSLAVGMADSFCLHGASEVGLEGLSELVRATKAKEADAINLEGAEAEIKFLVDDGWTREALEEETDNDSEALHVLVADVKDEEATDLIRNNTAPGLIRYLLSQDVPRATIAVAVTHKDRGVQA